MDQQAKTGRIGGTKVLKLSGGAEADKGWERKKGKLQRDSMLCLCSLPFLKRPAR